MRCPFREGTAQAVRGRRHVRARGEDVNCAERCHRRAHGPEGVRAANRKLLPVSGDAGRSADPHDASEEERTERDQNRRSGKAVCLYVCASSKWALSAWVCAGWAPVCVRAAARASVCMPVAAEVRLDAAAFDFLVETIGSKFLGGDITEELAGSFRPKASFSSGGKSFLSPYESSEMESNHSYALRNPKATFFKPGTFVVSIEVDGIESDPEESVELVAQEYKGWMRELAKAQEPAVVGTLCCLVFLGNSAPHGLWATLVGLAAASGLLLLRVMHEEDPYESKTAAKVKLGISIIVVVCMVFTACVTAFRVESLMHWKIKQRTEVRYVQQVCARIVALYFHVTGCAIFVPGRSAPGLCASSQSGYRIPRGAWCVVLGASWTLDVAHRCFCEGSACTARHTARVLSCGSRRWRNRPRRGTL